MRRTDLDLDKSVRDAREAAGLASDFVHDVMDAARETSNGAAPDGFLLISERDASRIEFAISQAAERAEQAYREYAGSE